MNSYPKRAEFWWRGNGAVARTEGDMNMQEIWAGARARLASVEEETADLARLAFDTVETGIAAGVLSADRALEHVYAEAVDVLKEGEGAIVHSKLWAAIAAELQLRAAAPPAPAAAPPPEGESVDGAAFSPEAAHGGGN